MAARGGMVTGRPRRFWMLALCALLPACGVGDLIGGLGTSKVNLPAGPSMAPDETAASHAAFHQINAARAAAGVPPLRWHAPASDVAYDHAVDMRVRGYYDHWTPEGAGPCVRLRAAGVEAFACGAENIARGPDTPEDVVAMWLGSPAHRATLLNPVPTHVGIGVSMGGDGPWWVMDVFTPAVGE